MSIDIHADGRIQLMYSSTAIHSGPVALNLLHNALLRYHCGSNCWIKLTSRPLIHPRQVIYPILRIKLYIDSKNIELFFITLIIYDFTFTYFYLLF